MELTNKDDFKKIIEENEILIVMFYSTWCPPCKMVHPIVCEYIDNNPDDLILMINNDNINEINKIYNVRTVPTFLEFHNGIVIDEIEGFIEYEELEEEFVKLRGLKSEN